VRRRSSEKRENASRETEKKTSTSCAAQGSHPIARKKKGSTTSVRQKRTFARPRTMSRYNGHLSTRRARADQRKRAKVPADVGPGRARGDNRNKRKPPPSRGPAARVTSPAYLARSGKGKRGGSSARRRGEERRICADPGYNDPRMRRDERERKKRKTRAKAFAAPQKGGEPVSRDEPL